MYTGDDFNYAELIAGDVVEMRGAIAKEKGDAERWDIKYAAGGLVDQGQAIARDLRDRFRPLYATPSGAYKVFEVLPSAVASRGR